LSLKLPLNVILSAIVITPAAHDHDALDRDDLDVELPDGDQLGLRAINVPRATASICGGQAFNSSKAL